MEEEISPESIRADLYESKRSQRRRRCPSVISVLSSLLERTVARNKRRPAAALTTCGSKLAAFSGVRVPVISVEAYLERIFKYAHCSTSCFVVAYAYIDRLVQLHPELRITATNVHRVVITSVLVSAKFLDDIYYDNAYYAQIGGISISEMNKLEIDFLFLLNFRLQVTMSVFESYCMHLEREVALGGGYQIEKTLNSICGLDDDCNSQRKTTTLPMRCSEG